MITQHQDAIAAQVGKQPLPFFLAYRDAFEIVVAQPTDEVAGIEVDRLQPAFHRTDRHGRGGVGVADRVGPIDVAMEIGVLGETSLVHRIGAAIERVAIDIDLDEIAGTNL